MLVIARHSGGKNRYSDSVTDEWDDTNLVPAPVDPVDTMRDRAYLVIARGNNVGKVYAIEGPEMVIGRAAGADLRLSDDGVSRLHCKLQHEVHGFVVEDLGSRNGTFCNGERLIRGRRALFEGDQLQLGTTSVLRFTYKEMLDAPSIPPIDDPSSIRDTLTGTFSRRYFVGQLETEVLHALRHGTRLSIVLIHVDRFATICTPRGQAFCEQVGTTVADHIATSIHGDDMVSRFANYKFAVMSRWASPADTFMLAERLRASSAGLTFPTEDEPPQRITFSVAVAVASELGIETAAELLIAAETALHSARSVGGNRVVLCSQDLLREPRGRLQV